ncbi:MAG: SEL1-like repeat protein [Holosporales bacterium]|jgi:TPR repeat protein|nr:SEL1-like repeat protein [Holosporales bacterium]
MNKKSIKNIYRSILCLLLPYISAEVEINTCFASNLCRYAGTSTSDYSKNSPEGMLLETSATPTRQEVGRTKTRQEVPTGAQPLAPMPTKIERLKDQQLAKIHIETAAERLAAKKRQAEREKLALLKKDAAIVKQLADEGDIGAHIKYALRVFESQDIHLGIHFCEEKDEARKGKSDQPEKTLEDIANEKAELIEAVKYLKVAADRENANAQFYLGICLSLGLGTNVDLTAGTEYFKKAAEQGHLGAKLHYAERLIHADEVGTNAREGLRYLTQLIDIGFPEGDYAYSIYLEQKGDQKEKSNAEKYCKQAADLGLIPAQNAYACNKMFGINGTINLFEAAKYSKMSADKGDPTGQVYYGLCLYRGFGTAPDEIEAVKYFKLSADQGDPEGQNNYGACLRNGDGVARNEKEGIRYHKLSADQGCMYGQLYYANAISEQGNFGEAAKYYKLAADQGNAEAQYNYGEYLYSRTGVAQDRIEATKYLKLAADQGNAEAQSLCATLLP